MYVCVRDLTWTTDASKESRRYGLNIYTCSGDTHENPRSILSLSISSVPARTYTDPEIQCIRSGDFSCFQRVASSSTHPVYYNPSSCQDTDPQGNWPDLQWCKWAESKHSEEFSDICFSDCDSNDLTLLDNLMYHCPIRESLRTISSHYAGRLRVLSSRRLRLSSVENLGRRDIRLYVWNGTSRYVSKGKMLRRQRGNIFFGRVTTRPSRARTRQRDTSQ